MLLAAVGIHTVEARHAAWVRHLAGLRPAATAFDEPIARATVLQNVASMRFVVRRAPHTTRKRPPRFTG